jgi:acyl transferase domain-containing protein
MRQVGQGYADSLSKQIQFRPLSIPMFSSVTEDTLPPTSQLNAAYWRSNLESPVLFNAAMQNLIKSNSENQVFLEIGPQPVLAGPIRQILAAKSRTKDEYISTLRRGEQCSESILKTVGNLFVVGMPLDFEKIVPSGNVLANLPLYQWTHDAEYWTETRVARQWRFREHPHHELLGSRTLESSDLLPEWRNVLHTRDINWLQDHLVLDQCVFPFAGFVAMAGEAMRRLTNSDEYTFQEIFVQAPLVLDDVKPAELVTSFRPVRLTVLLDSKAWEFTIVSHNGRDWTKHCAGQVTVENLLSSSPTKVVSRYPRQVTNPYFAFRQKGLQYGPIFRRLSDVTAAPDSKTASATMAPSPPSSSAYAIHPTVIDNCLQLLGIASCEGVFRRAEYVFCNYP